MGSWQDDVGRIDAAMDAEVRAEQAAYEELAARARWRSRTMAAVAEELRDRGDRVAAHVATRTLLGTVEHVGDDLAILALEQGGTADLHLAGDVVLRVVERVRTGGRDRGVGPRTFVARLTEHETAGTPVTVLTTLAEEPTGVIRAVAVDHVLLTGREREWFIPHRAVAAVLATPPS